jgi:thiol-disulfide isomerase/thioredoxin
MNRRGQWALLIALAAAAGLGAGLWHGGHFAATPAAPDLPGQRPPGLVEGDILPEDLALTALDGTPLPLSALRGRPLLINVWASWCAPCVEEMPELAAFASEQGDNGIQVIGLALDSPEAVHAFLQRIPVPYPIAIEPPGPADSSVALGNARGLLPYTVLIDAQGRLHKRKLGPFAPGEIAGWANRGN